MSDVLYRKYRPQRFEDLTGQRAIVTTLTNQLLFGTTAHAYCFSGPRGVGKTTIARLLAKALNCTSRVSDSAEPCLGCAQCMAMAQGNSLDLIEVDAASHTGVDHVRDAIIAATRVATAGAKYKVFIIDEVHMLSISAFNALLKTLEEPPAHVVFIVATTEIHKVPATILSRCQRFQFSRISHAEMVERLKMLVEKEGRSVAPAVLEEIAGRSEGSLRDAETTLGQILGLEETAAITMDIAELVIPRTVDSDVIKFGVLLVGNNTQLAIQELKKFEESGGEPLRLVEGLIQFFREVLIVTLLKKDTAQAQGPHSRMQAILAVGTSSTPQNLLRILDILLRRRSLASDTVNDALVLEMAVLESMLGLEPATQPVGPEGVEELLKN